MFMRTIAAIAALMALASCDQVGADGYSFDRKEFDRPTMTITVVEHPSLDDLRAKAPDSTEQVRDRLFGWSLVRPTSCEVHVVAPTVRWMPEALGHEVAHCHWGRWHPDMNGGGL